MARWSSSFMRIIAAGEDPGPPATNEPLLFLDFEILDCAAVRVICVVAVALDMDGGTKFLRMLFCTGMFMACCSGSGVLPVVP